MSFMVSFCAVLGEIWDLFESVSEGFPTYSVNGKMNNLSVCTSVHADLSVYYTNMD